MTQTSDKVRQVLEDHEAYTVVRYKNSDPEYRVGYQCKCGAEDEPSTGLWGRLWLIEHQTEEIVKVL